MIFIMVTATIAIIKLIMMVTVILITPMITIIRIRENKRTS